MSQEIVETYPVNRRGFIKTALAVTAGAVAASAGTAQIMKNSAGTVITTVPSLPPTDLSRAVEAVNAGGDMMQQLVAAHADNLRLQTELDSLQRRLAAITGNQNNPDARAEILETQLGDTRHQLGVVAGLVALYEQLEGIDLDETVDAGLQALGGSLSTLVGQLPTVREAVAAGQQALDQLEAEIPLVDSGRMWLDHRLQRLSQGFQALEAVLQEAVEDIGPLLSLLNQWFQNVLKWLPFGMGRTAGAVMEALTGVVNDTPATISGLRVNVSQPLNIWLQDEDGEKPLQKRLVRPLREKTIASASEMEKQAESVKSTFDTALAQPVNNAVQIRRQMRNLIAAYRQQHEI